MLGSSITKLSMRSAAQCENFNTVTSSCSALLHQGYQMAGKHEEDIGLDLGTRKEIVATIF